ncbi:zinc-ribbon domain containing protein [Candidatus Berkelbacteria bacterium]|nr:zinc-ribbon domain containing protein [Candidatus Berkelbacteria bacterium]
MYQDQTLTCRDCGQQFVWTAGEQEFYAQKGLSAPSRCKECRAKKKAERAGGGMGGNAGPREMYDIVCANCGKAAQVPFKPSRPDVFCRECFDAKRTQGGGFGGGTAPSDDAGAPSTDDAAA